MGISVSCPVAVWLTCCNAGDASKVITIFVAYTLSAKKLQVRTTEMKANSRGRVDAVLMQPTLASITVITVLFHGTVT